MADIKIACRGADTLPLDLIEDFQGNLKKRGKKEIDQIIKSIEKYGFSFPFFVWNGDGHNRCLDGHGRIQALAEMRKRGASLPLFPVAYIDAKDEAEAKQKLLRLNSQYGQMTIESVLEFSDGLEIDWDDVSLPSGSLGMTNDNGVDSLIDSEPQISRADELKEVWGTETGQLWALGDHWILCGDSTKKEDVERVMHSEKASLVFTDPPYGVSVAKKNRMLNTFQPSGRCLADIEDDDLSPEELKSRLVPAFTNIRTIVMADDCTVFVTAPQNGELGMMMMMMMKDSGLPVRHVLMWLKDAPTFSMGRLDYDYQHEPILLTWGKRHKRPMKGEHRTSVWKIPKPRAAKEHPTMKPVELVVNAILNNSDHGDITFDAYNGSGTSIIAAEQTGRKCRAIEISPGYVAVALQRWADATGRVPVLLGEDYEEVKPDGAGGKSYAIGASLCQEGTQ